MANITDDVKNALTSVLSGAGDIVSTTQTVAKDNVVKALEGVSDVATSGISAVGEVVGAGVNAVSSAGQSVTAGVTGLVRGAVDGAKDAGVNTTEAASEAASVAVKETSKVGGD